MTCRNPDTNYYHRVVDCQYACPAHTPVPEYIRLIAQGRYTDAYLLNRESNVFPGVLGRVCDRPCEPACRRGRVEKDPVAICRLKRVAADFRDQDIESLLPIIPKQKSGKKVALVGSGPASLTVASDLVRLGHEIHIFERDHKLGGAMRASVPTFRLPEQVLDEEIGFITNRGGVTVHSGHEIKSFKNLLQQSFDAYFIGTGAPQGRDLKIPGRDQAGAQVLIGLNFLADVAFGHKTSLPPRVLIIGGGNTAMDCCRTAKRLGGKNVTVIAPESFEEMLASPWEKDDAIEEGIEIKNHLLPQEFQVSSEGKLSGVKFQHLKQCYDVAKRWAPIASGEADQVVPCDVVILAIGQNTAFPFVERDLGINFSDDGNRLVVDPVTFQTTLPKVFVGGDAAFGPKNIIWAVAHGHDAAISIVRFLNEQPLMPRPPVTHSFQSQKMGLHEWSYDQSYDAVSRQKVPHVAVQKRFEDIKREVELGFDVKAAIEEASRCLNCDVQTVFAASACIECDACIDICPVSCLTLTSDGDDASILEKLTAPAIHYPSQDIFVSEGLKQTNRVMVKDEDLCLHCGLCAERCPTGAWDMQKSIFNLPKAQNEYLGTGASP